MNYTQSPWFDGQKCALNHEHGINVFCYIHKLYGDTLLLSAWTPENPIIDNRQNSAHVALDKLREMKLNNEQKEVE